MQFHPLNNYLQDANILSSADDQPSDDSDNADEVESVLDDPPQPDNDEDLDDSDQGQSQNALIKPARGVAPQVSEACHCCRRLD